jgi:hypothetical protein
MLYCPLFIGSTFQFSVWQDQDSVYLAYNFFDRFLLILYPCFYFSSKLCQKSLVRKCLEAIDDENEVLTASCILMLNSDTFNMVCKTEVIMVDPPGVPTTINNFPFFSTTAGCHRVEHPLPGAILLAWIQ